MKAAAFLLTLALAGYASSTHFAWKAGKQYNYGVRARLFSGQSDINTQYAGLELNYKIVLTVIGPNTLHLKPESVKGLELNSVLKGGWRDAELENETPAEISAQLQRYLESPMELHMNAGIIESIKVESYLPTWAVNIKKAQASHFVANTAGVNSVISGNLNRQTNSIRPEEANDESGFFYETMEETVHGECETYYTVSQNGPFDWPFQFQQQAQPGQKQQNDNSNESGQQQQQQQQDDDDADDIDNSQQDRKSDEEEVEFSRRRFQYAVFKRFNKQNEFGSREESQEENNYNELPWPKEFSDFCAQNDQVYEIIKSVNFTACKNKPVLAYTTSPGVYERAGDNAMGSGLTRAFITRYLACGQDRKQYTILKIKQEEQINTGIRLEQKTMAGTSVNITLLSVQQAQQVEQIKKSKTIKGLSYTFDPKEQELQRQRKINNAFSDANDVEENEDEEQNDESQERAGQRLGRTTQRPRSSFESQQNSSEEENENEIDNENQRSKWSNYKKYVKTVRPRFGFGSRRSSDENESRQEQSREESYKTEAENAGPLPKPDLQNAPLSPLLVSPLQSSGMQKRVVALMEEIKTDILNEKSMAEAETLSKISTMAKIVRQLNYAQILDLYHQIASKSQTEEDQVSRNVYLDAISIAGTNPAILVQADLINKGEIQGEEAAQLISVIPMYVRTPTKAFIQQIFKTLVESSALENNLQGKTTALLAFSNLVYQAWVDGRIKNSRYPVALYGEFGNQKDASRLYAQHFVRNLKQALRKEQSEGHNKHWTVTYLKSLGNLGTPEVIPMVQQILDQSNDPYIKTHAIFALSRMIISRSAVNVPVSTSHIQSDDRQVQDFLTDEFVEKQVMPILVAAAFDKGEHPETRMAAASLLVYTTSADTAIWQQLAYSTWFETSQEFHSFVYSTLKSLTQIDQEGASGALYNANQQARAVLSLAKPITPGYAKSRNTFHAGFVQYLQSAYSHQFSYFGSKDSNVPNYVYYRNQIQYSNNGFGVTPVQFSAYGHTAQKLASFAFKQLKIARQQMNLNKNGQNENDSDSQGQSDENQEAHQYFEKIHSLLGIKRRHQEEDIEGSIDIKIRNEMQRFFSINEDDMERWYKQAVANLPQLMSTGFQINYQKTWHAVEHSFEMPTAMGVPVSYAFRMPVHISIRGTLKLAIENGLEDIQLQAELHPVYAYKTHAHLAFKVPFTGNKYQSGIHRHVVIETPFRALVQKAPGGQVVIAVTPSQLTKGLPSGRIPTATFHQIPYTAIVTDSLWPTSHKEGGQMSIVHAADVESPFLHKGSFGQNALGFAFEYQEESEYLDQNQGQSGWINFWKQFHSHTCLFNLGWLGGDRVRYVQRTLVLDVSKSETKTLVFTLGGKREQSPTVKDLWEDSSSQSSQSTEESASSESKQDSSSQQQDSNERDNQSRQGRQQNRRASVQSAEDNSQGGLVIAAALIGKKTPVRSIQDGIADVQHILQKGSPSTVQYLVQVSSFSGRFYVRAATGEGANEAAKSLPQTCRSLAAIRRAILDSPNTKAYMDSCAEFEGEYDAPSYANRGQLIVLRKRLLSEDLAVKVKAELQFGRSCSKMPHEIKLKGKLQRGPKQTEYAQSQSAQAQKCTQDEKKGFYISPVCMAVAEQQAAALNQGDFDITYTDMPKAFVNRTDDFEDLAKAILYPYMSNDRFNQGTGDNKLRVQFHLTPNKEFLDVHITKPHSKLSFQSIRTNRVIRAALPFTATQSLANNFRDRAFRADSDPSCSIQGNFVNTFDNVTYRFSEKAGENCYHVLTQDCSGRQQLSVLVKDVTTTQKKVVIILEAKTKIELTPQEQQRVFQNTNSKFQVDINDVHIESLPRIVRSQQSGQQIARVESTAEGGIQIFSKHVDISTNGDYVVVFAANHLRNRTCGICGDFNGEKTGEMKSPQNCPMSSGSALVASYAIQPQALNPSNSKEGKCQVNSQLKKQIERENSQCQPDAPYQQRSVSKYSNQNVGISSKCIDEILTAIRRSSYTLVDSILKLYIQKTEVRHRYANKIADALVKRAEEFLEHEDSAQKLSEMLGDFIGILFRRYHPSAISDRLARIIARIIKPLFAKAFLAGLNPICEQTKCCIPSRHASYSLAEIKEDIQFATEDSAESDEDSNDDIPFLGAEAKGQSCQVQLEDQLATGVSKVVHLALQSDESTTSSKRKVIAKRVYKEVRKAIGKAIKDKEEIVQSILDAIERAAPNTYEQLITPIIQDITRYSIKGLQQARNCNFDGIRLDD